ncbi:MAG: hypothetical protein ACFCVG_06600 [Kineosporiaceae bacterium]
MAIAGLSMMTLTACGGEDRAATVELPPSPSPSTSPKSATPGSMVGTSAPMDASGGDGTDVTVDQLIAALPTVGDLPTGWTVETAPAAAPEEEDNSTISPPGCSVLFDGLRETGGTRESAATATYSAGTLGPVLDVEIRYYPNGFDASALDGFAEALGQCPTFAIQDPEDGSITFAASPLSFPDLGDSTLAVRLAGETDRLEVVSDTVAIGLDRYQVLLVSGGLTTMDPAALETIARSTVDRVNGR